MLKEAKTVLGLIDDIKIHNTHKQNILSLYYVAKQAKIDWQLTNKQYPPMSTRVRYFFPCNFKLTCTYHQNVSFSSIEYIYIVIF